VAVRVKFDFGLGGPIGHTSSRILLLLYHFTTLSYHHIAKIAKIILAFLHIFTFPTYQACAERLKFLQLVAKINANCNESCKIAKIANI
jgi:hypothetical protein